MGKEVYLVTKFTCYLLPLKKMINIELQIGSSVSAQYGVLGYSLGMRVDMGRFRQSMTSSTTFGRRSETYSSGSESMHGM